MSRCDTINDDDSGHWDSMDARGGREGGSAGESGEGIGPGFEGAATRSTMTTVDVGIPWPREMDAREEALGKA